MQNFIMIVCHPNEEEPRLVVESLAAHEGALGAMQAQVGGLIETCGRLQLSEEICLDAYCNEIGDDLDPNRHTPYGLVQGPVIVTASNAKGATISLGEAKATAAALEWARSWPRVNAPRAESSARAIRADLLRILRDEGLVK